MPLTIAGVASSSAGLFLSLPTKPADHCHALCNDNADILSPNALDGAVLSPRAAHAAHICKPFRSGDNGGVRRGYEKALALRRADIAVFARLGGSMVVTNLLRQAGVDMSQEEGYCSRRVFWISEVWKMEVMDAMR